MNRRIPRLSAALAVLAALLTACSDESGASANPDQPTPTPTSSRSWTLLSDDPDYETPLPAGRYGLTVAENVNPDLPWAVVRAPAGCDHFSTQIFFCMDEDETVTASVGYWTLHAVRPDPCKPESEVVDTVDDAVAAFQEQRHSQVSQPRRVTLDGYDGLYVELRIPEKFNFAACPEFHPWDIDSEGGLPYYQSPGLERLWILDIDGDLAVINVSDWNQLARAMVESLEFVPSTD